MIDYETFVKIKVYKDQHGLKCSQIARELNLDYRTVEKWLDQKQYQQRKSPQRASKLDPFKGQIVRMLETHPYTATQIFQRIREEDFVGGYTIDVCGVYRQPNHGTFFGLSSKCI
jgi:transposase